MSLRKSRRCSRFYFSTLCAYAVDERVDINFLERLRDDFYFFQLNQLGRQFSALLFNVTSELQTKFRYHE